jgi:hypothetical protein
MFYGDLQMIDLETEELILLSDVPHRIPKKRNGQPVGLGAVYRWARAGIRGNVLETIQVGGAKCTSLPALNRFFSRLTRRTDDVQAARPGRLKERSIAAAARKFERAGV